MTSVGGIVNFHWADFQGVLSAHIHPEVSTSHFSKKLSSYVERTPTENGDANGPVTLYFEDGTTAECDVLVGADGIKSATRRVMLTEAAARIANTDAEGGNKLLGLAEPAWSDSVAYRAVIQSEALEMLNPEHTALRQCQLVSI